jgi:hypothetical protein
MIVVKEFAKDLKPGMMLLYSVVTSVYELDSEKILVNVEDLKTGKPGKRIYKKNYKVSVYPKGTRNDKNLK